MNAIEENLRAVGIDTDSIMETWWSVRLNTGGRIQEEWKSEEEAREFVDSGKLLNRYNQSGNVIHYKFQK